MRQPDIYAVEALHSWPNKELVQLPDGRQYWRLARPMVHNAFSWRWRFKLAWEVFTGEYDAVRWDK